MIQIRKRDKKEKNRKIYEDKMDDKHKYSYVVRSLLENKGINKDEEIEDFLNPSYENHLHDPYLMKDMEKAVKRILSAIDNKEKIVVYCDYDADGLPGGAILHDFFNSAGVLENVSFYIPNRDEEGFGFHVHAVEKFIREGVSLFITVDCGIVDFEAVEVANENKADVIITDHHLPQADKIPKAYAIVNPAQDDCKYPFKKLCGAGVAFKLVIALIKKRPELMKDGYEKWLLDLVGIATLSDMVPLIGENRVLAKWGLFVLRRTKRHGLRILFRILKVDIEKITEEDIGFTLTPRINSASRLGEAEIAFRLLVETDQKKASAIAVQLNKMNDTRKGLSAWLSKSAKNKLADLPQIKNDGKQVIVLGNPEWKPAVLGPVANSLSEEFSCPVFMWGRAGGKIKGSCRAPKGKNVVKLMEAVPKGVFIEFGGHACSGGFSVRDDKIHLLEEHLNGAYKKVLEDKDFICLDDECSDLYDGELDVDDISDDLLSEIEKLSPFGMDNPRPKFLIKDAKISSIKFFGSNKEHVEIIFSGKSGKSISGISFFVKDKKWIKDIEKKDEVNVIMSLEESFFGGRRKIRLRILDIVI